MATMLSLLNPAGGVLFIVRHRDLLRQILLRNIAARYRGSVLGFVWSFANPLMMLAVYTFVFGFIFKMRWDIGELENNAASFPLIIFCGLAVFNIFAETVMASTSVVVSNVSYVKKVVFPLELLPLCSVLTSLAFGLAWFALLLAGTVLFWGHTSWTMLFLPLVLLPLLLFSGGIAFLLASLGVYLRDMPHLVGIITHIIFFLTPIFYPLAAVPENLRWIVRLNPLAVIVEQTRQVFLYGLPPDFSDLLLVSIFSLLVFLLGILWFIKTKKGFADVL